MLGAVRDIFWRHARSMFMYFKLQTCCTIVLLLFLCHQPFSGFSLVIIAIVTIIIAVMLVMSTQLRAATTPTNRSSQIIYFAIRHISYYSAQDIFCCTVSHSQSIVACQLISVDVVISMLHRYLVLVHLYNGRRWETNITVVDETLSLTTDSKCPSSCSLSSFLSLLTILVGLHY